MLMMMMMMMTTTILTATLDYPDRDQEDATMMNKTVMLTMISLFMMMMTMIVMMMIMMLATTIKVERGWVVCVPMHPAGPRTQAVSTFLPKYPWTNPLRPKYVSCRCMKLNHMQAVQHPVKQQASHNIAYSLHL